MVAVRVKRAYEAAAAGDGTRVLVDRLWPRGLSREAAQVDFWLKDVAPSDALRRSFGHDPAKWPQFRERYLAELADNPAVAQLRSLLRRSRTLTLLFAAKDIEHNNAIVLRELLTGADRS